MGTLDTAPHVEATDREQWRAWLERHHASEGSVWLITYRPGSGHPVLEYEAAVEEALCFGWVDSTGGRVDDLRTKLYFARRKPGSGWAATNKARVERLIADGRMAPAGLAAIEVAKANGAWELLDSVERLEVPADLAAALEAMEPARANWDAFPPSVRKQLLGWVVLAKRAETRAGRIAEIASRAARNERANQQVEKRPPG